MRRSKSCALALLAALAALPALAQSSEDKQLTVQYGDLHLDRPEGVLALYHRIELAAENVCGDVEGQGLAARAQWRACRDDALDAGVASMRNPALAKLHLESTGRDVTASEVAKH